MARADKQRRTSTVASKGLAKGRSFPLRLVEPSLTHPEPVLPGIRFFPSARAEAGVATFEEASRALGLGFYRLSRIAPSGLGTGAQSGDLGALHLVGAREQCLADLACHVTTHPAFPFVVLGADDDVLVQACLQAGARGFIPTRFDAAKMSAALELIRQGELYFPIKRTVQQTAAPMAPVLEERDDRGMRDYKLTTVEREVLFLASQGFTNLQIAQRRAGKEGTIKVHMNHIFAKLKVRTRCEAIALYLQKHSLDPDEWSRIENGTMDMRWLLSTMTHQHCKRGTMLFKRGDCGDRIYYLQNGFVSLEEFGIEMQPEDLFGEIGVFSPGHKRSATAVCRTDADLFTLSYEEVRRSYFLNPLFVFSIMKLVTARLIADRERARAATAR